MSDRNDFVVVAAVVPREKLEVAKERLRDLGTVHSSEELWGESGRAVGTDGEHGHLAAMKDLRYESEPPNDDDY